jgi:lysozyme family protein
LKVADFNEALAKVLVNEGGYAKDPDDRGGETYKGVARRYNPEWPGWTRIDPAKRARGFPKSLDKEVALQVEVATFYKQHYWDKFQGDVLPNQAVANELFDSAVNLGVTRAVEFLQRALNVLNRNGALYADLMQDGDFGPRSLAALRTYLKKDDPVQLLTVLNVLQGMHYIEVMTQSPAQEKFARGWLRRVQLATA